MKSETLHNFKISIFKSTNLILHLFHRHNKLNIKMEQKIIMKGKFRFLPHYYLFCLKIINDCENPLNFCLTMSALSIKHTRIN